jgi:hypothetical protein
MCNTSPRNYVASLLFFVVFSCAALVFVATRKPDYSLQSTIMRGNREIAVEFSVRPRFRWVIATPLDGIIHQADGEYPHHEFAYITYGTETSGPPSMPGDRSSKMPLTDEEWQSIGQWRSVWCQGAPFQRPPAATEAFYTVVFRCTNYREIKTVRILPDQMPLEIAILLRRAAEPPAP